MHHTHPSHAGAVPKPVPHPGAPSLSLFWHQELLWGPRAGSSPFSSFLLLHLNLVGLLAKKTKIPEPFGIRLPGVSAESRH